MKHAVLNLRVCKFTYKLATLPPNDVGKPVKHQNEVHIRIRINIKYNIRKETS